MDREMALSVAIIALIIKKKKRYGRKKSVWVRPWISRRLEHGVYNRLVPEMLSEDMDSYINFLRMSKDQFDAILAKIDPYIRKEDTHLRRAIPPGERLAITLRFLATGETYQSLQYSFRIPKNTISSIVPEVCGAIYLALKDEHLQIPRTEDEWKKIAQDYETKWNFPNCIGAIDGKHVRIMPPCNSGSLYYNYKGHFSIVLLALVDANYRFIYVDTGSSGRASDGGVYRNSSLARAIEQNTLSIPKNGKQISPDIQSQPMTIVADDAFPLKKFIMKPYPGRGMNRDRRIFNYRLSRARRVVENAFGILANRFRVFHTSIALSPAKTELLILAACTLHNYLLPDTADIMFDREDPNLHEIREGQWRESGTGMDQILRQRSNRCSDDARLIRDKLCEYFVSPEGSLPWQWIQTE